jgi:hypothetical protein
MDIAIDEVGTHKVASIVTDNAANMRAAWKILSERYPGQVTKWICCTYG